MRNGALDLGANLAKEAAASTRSELDCGEGELKKEPKLNFYTGKREHPSQGVVPRTEAKAHRN